MPADAPPPPWPDIKDVVAAMNAHVEALAHDLLPAGKRNGNYYSVGSLSGESGGSLYITLNGPRRGHWKDAATGEIGDALDLLTQCRFAGDKRAGYLGALDWLGIPYPGASPQRQERQARPEPPPQGEDTREKFQQVAKQRWHEARPSIVDTPVDAYLMGRGIDIRQLLRVPGALRFHGDLWNNDVKLRLPAMVAAIHGPDGTHQATHRTWLERTGGGWIKARLPRNKMVLGQFPGGSIRLARGASNKPLKDAPAGDPVVIAEGIESALSIAIAVPEVRVLCAVSQGNMASVWLPEQIGAVILAIDNDTKPAAQAAAQRIVERYLDRGCNVRVARSPVGNDFNDALTGWG